MSHLYASFDCTLSHPGCLPFYLVVEKPTNLSPHPLVETDRDGLILPRLVSLASCIHHVYGDQRIAKSNQNPPFGTLQKDLGRRNDPSAARIAALQPGQPAFRSATHSRSKAELGRFQKLHDTSNDPYLGGVWKGPGQRAQRWHFTFSVFPNRNVKPALQSMSPTGKLVRTLWMNRAYNRGTFGEIWDGKDDNGNTVFER